MEVYNILILDVTNNYANRLKTALQQEAPNVNLFWADKLEEINNVRANYSLNAVIVSDVWKIKGGTFSARDMIEIPLHEERGEERSIRTLFRSDPIEATSAALLQILKNSTIIIGVTGVGGGCGKTTMAWALCHQYKRMNRRVFFLSLESYMASSPFSGPAACGLAEVVDALDMGKSLEKTILEACEKHPKYPGIDAFALSEYNIDRSEISASDIRQLLTIMKRMNRWDVIIVDMDSRMDDRLFEVWQQATRMVLMVPCSQIGLERLSYVEKELSFRERRGEAKLSRLVPVLNYYRDDMNGFQLFDNPIRLGIRQINGAVKLSSKMWNDALRENDKLINMYKRVCDEVIQ